MHNIKLFISVSAIIVLLSTVGAFAQGSAFVYQGKLSDGAAAANGTYQFQFRLFDAASGGNQIGQTIGDLPATVTNGIFAVTLDFGASSYDGSARYLEISVRPNNGGQAYTLLNPRQAVASTPYAVRSLNANQAITADNSANLGGLPAQQYTQTTDPRLSDDRNPLPNSPNYVQNTTNAQANANFNVSGTGKANVLEAKTQFNLNGARVLHATGTDNLFAGAEAGAVTTGGFNAFFGAQSGKSNTTGFNNTFAGAYAGRANASGANNAFFGANAGLTNNGGSFNSFFGSNAGFSNTSGASNSFFGNGAGLNNSIGLNNSFFGRSSGADVTNAGNNAFFGAFSGENTTTGGNSYFGAFSGQKNTTGFNNSFFGLNSGVENINGSNNTYFGANTGQTVGATGSGNTFVGSGAGQTNSFGQINGSNNTAVGFNARVAGGVSNAVAIGVNAFAAQNNSIVLGASTAKVSVPGALEVTGDASVAGFKAESLNVLSNNLFTDRDPVDLKFQLNVPNGRIKADEVVSGSVSSGFISSDTQGIFGSYVEASGFVWRNGLPPVSNQNTHVCAYSNANGVVGLTVCSSSIRYKKDVETYTGGLDVLKRLRPVTFRWKGDDVQDLGFIAEEVNAIEPLLSTFNRNGEVQGVKYETVSTVLVNSVKEQQAQIEAQREENQKLSDRVEKLQTEIEALRAIVCAANGAAVCRPKQ
ncbi:MAG TPA: tail fiber domain-containing protein [Pyrinomonadaceae bacterium]|jgi:hypothetical protein